MGEAGVARVHYWRYGEHTVPDFRIVLLSPEGAIVRGADHFDDDIAALLPLDSDFGRPVGQASP